MNIKDIIDKIYVGVVEDNIDPYRLGRIKIRVQSMYNDIPLEDIPYATPFKSLDGRSFNIPAIGKVVNVVFDNGNIYMPVYHYSENFNINLQRKLDSLKDDEYKDFQAFTFDHKTQHYIDNSGYRLDYYYNQLHINNESINLRLKDNTNTLNLGSRDADQDAVLGTNFFKWFDKFINKLLLPTSLNGNLGAPILKPEIDVLLQEYLGIKDTFLSKHVKLPENNKIEIVKRDVETIVETNDSELLVNNQSPFVVNQKNTENSNIISEDIKQKIVTVNEVETEKIIVAQPTKILSTEEIDYHEDIIDAPSKNNNKMVNDDGEEYDATFDDLAETQSQFYSDVNTDKTIDNPTDTYDEVEIVDDPNYGIYETSNVPSNIDKSDINRKSNINIPNSVTKTDSEGNVIIDTMPIYILGKIVANEEYLYLQGKIIIKKYYEPTKIMIDAAKSENVILKLNFSYRTYLEQYQQRKKNQLKQYTDEELYTNSSKLYNPYTAIPGYSIHERGAAFDFSVNGGKSAAYKWLVKNAYKFGFYRTIPSEVWHFEYQPWTYRGGVKPNDMFKWVKKEDSSWLGLT